MLQSPDSRKHLSLMLSEVLEDIGVNDRMRMRTRRVIKLMENMDTITMKSFGNNTISYYLGSKIEGTTTYGLKSDFDKLCLMNYYNVIQNRSEWEHGKINFFMIQDEHTTPGYCFLQLLQDNRPLPATVVPDKRYISDWKGRILHKNKLYEADNTILVTQHGPSYATQGRKGFNDADRVLAYPCKSWPKSAESGWLERQSIGKWPTQDMRRYAASTVCCVVPTGSKVSEYPELEWRISTSLAERCLMFDLDITQIKCYVLLKMILKSLLNPQGEINISSFMCKTILLHCIEQKEPSIWKENNLLECLKDCLMKLSSCVQNDNLSHFIIPDNNLIAGQLTAETKRQLLININDFIQNDVHSLLKINIDNLGHRLQVKLKLVPERQYNFYSSLNTCEIVSAFNYILFSNSCGGNYTFFLKKISNEDIGIMKQNVEGLMSFNNNHHKLEQAAFTFLAPFVCSTYGSVLASESIGLKHQVSPQALAWLLNGFESDVSSGRLKLASVFYSSGDIEKTELILRNTEEQFYSFPVFHFCNCPYLVPTPKVPVKVERVFNEQNVDCVKYITAICVRFLKKEINCVPHELQYEMFRSTQDDIKHRDKYLDLWMDFAVVDSLPFLYFLQYKVYRHLHMYKDQLKAINKLANIIKTDKTLGHKETALNVLGQCMEQENRPKQAIKCYLLSLRQRERNNVARIHICRLLSGVLVDKEVILYSRK
ncbi:uncharacterized protein LOC132759109 [Ruditapes philippinarum]|uniref:uncharacterized protein LOC132759109 n=1 Tax=Ruditapes philippinarum TaxID=129788 RepID=UPI00295B5CE8|nr:uncharacterized protein LOC132759109 [Ruditapes philippinarum]